jgi:flagellar hook-associated protein 1 FlgK
MSLSSALTIAQSALLATSRQTATVARNVADASNPDYSRRTATVTSMAPGARIVAIQRAADEQLLRQNLAALSAWSGKSTIASGLDRLDLAVNGVDNTASPSTAITDMQKALQLYATSPSNQTLGANVIEAARRVTQSLNQGTQQIQAFRTDADGQIADAAAKLDALLGQFQTANEAVISGTRAGTDVSDALDQRDGLLKKISEYVPVSSYTRGDNDMVVITAGGSTLFETVPRSVSFEASPGYTAGMSGNTVYIDNVPLSLDGPDAGGKLGGLLQLRDGTAATMQSQLDEIARGLVTAFSEAEPGLGQPRFAGLFTWVGAPVPPLVPAAGTLVNGLAGSITINAGIDPSQGGNLALLRDGGINGAAYVVKPSGAGSSYADLLIAYGDRLEQPMSFDAVTEIGGSSSGLAGFASDSIGWVASQRQLASSDAATKEALAQRSADALSNATGVNVDTEMSLMLDLEHTYQASARLMATVGTMLDALLEAVR